MLLYVDDKLVAGIDKTETDAIWDEIGEFFTIKKLGKACKFLGFEIERDRANRCIFLY
jgi:hypothetical protein